MNQEFTITVFSENSIGLLNRITINFTKRKLNIESLTVSETAIQGFLSLLLWLYVHRLQLKIWLNSSKTD
jgi:acetolactate synthase small subunit